MLTQDGRLVVADFGRPRGSLQWALFTMAGWIDGWENTAPPRNSRFEQALREAFGTVRSAEVWRTAFGSLGLFVCG